MRVVEGPLVDSAVESQISTVSDLPERGREMPLQLRAEDLGLDGPLQPRYELQRLLGKGSMGRVYRGYDTLLDRAVAIKVLAASSVPQAHERFLREARAAAALNHPHIVSIFDFGAAGDRLYLVMELVSGGSLCELASPSLPAILCIAKQLCLALDHAHSHGIVHRDVKPANVLLASRVGESPVVKLADLGLAVFEGAARLTTEGMIVGTGAYLAPEQAKGGFVDGRADLYSLGVLLYELVAGRLPFAGNLCTLISQHLHAPVVPPSVHRSDLQPEVERIILRLLAKDPAQRFTSARDLAAALAASGVA